jgi:hypothetical protein
MTASRWDVHQHFINAEGVNQPLFDDNRRGRRRRAAFAIGDAQDDGVAAQREIADDDRVAVPDGASLEDGPCRLSRWRNTVELIS